MFAAQWLGCKQARSMQAAFYLPLLGSLINSEALTRTLRIRACRRYACENEECITRILALEEAKDTAIAKTMASIFNKL